MDHGGGDGHLEAILREPADPVRSAVVCHPHPQGGGTMNNNVVYRVAKALAERRTSVLRFNFRGVGRSTGEYAGGVGEVDDARAALDFMAARHPELPLWQAGFSFGARVGLQAGIADRRVSRLLAVGLAVRMFDLSFLEGERRGLPLAIVQAAQDEYGDRGEIEAFVARLAQPVRLWIVEDATHLFPGRLDALERTVGPAIEWLEQTAPLTSTG
ncbi:MAG TPA: alpha/beta family hydrolase [Polyangia bacterium]